MMYLVGEGQKVPPAPFNLSAALLVFFVLSLVGHRSHYVDMALYFPE